MSNREPFYDNTPADDPFATTGSARPASTRDTTQQKADEAKEKGQEAMNKAGQKGKQAEQKAHQAADKAEARADKGMNQAASGLDEAAGKLRQQGGQQGGSVESAANMAAGTMESASGYLRNTDTDQMMDDLEDYIRRNPAQSLLIAAGTGFVLSKLFR